MKKVNNHIKTNISVLRKEARLSKEEFSSLMNESIEVINCWEKGTIIPTQKQIELMCPYLRISVEDFLERDILKERRDATRSMKRHSRGEYSWYFGSRKTKWFYISYLIVIVVVFCLAYFIQNSFYDKISLTPEERQLVKYYKVVFSLAPVGVVSSVYGLVYLFKNNLIAFRWWYLTFISVLFGPLVLIGVIATPLFAGYSIYKGIIKNGKVR